MPRESILERRVYNSLIFHGFPEPVREHRFHPIRRWKFDFAYPDHKIAIECEGGIWVKGAHTRGAHFNSDCEKYNSAIILGWRILRYTTNTIDMIPNDLGILMPKYPISYSP